MDSDCRPNKCQKAQTRQPANDLLFAFALLRVFMAFADGVCRWRVRALFLFYGCMRARARAQGRRRGCGRRCRCVYLLCYENRERSE